MPPKKRYRPGKDQRYRERLKQDPIRYQEYLRKEKERNSNRKRNIKDVPDRDARILRSAWKKNSRNYRTRQKIQARTDEYASRNTPPVSPVSADMGQRGHHAEHHVHDRVRSGRKKIRRDRAKAYKKIKQLEQQLKEKHKAYEKYKKQAWRLKIKLMDSPTSRTRCVIGKEKVSDNVRKTLLKQFALISGIKHGMSMAKGHRDKQIMSKLLINKIIKRYRAQSYTCKAFRIYQKPSIRHRGDNPFVHCRKVRKDCYGHKMADRVKQFLERDDNSRLLPGKRDCITYKQVKKQRRLMLQNLRNLHLKFLSENPNTSLSYSMFCRVKPFWIQRPSIQDRETCACKTHENLQFMANALKRIGVLESNDLELISTWLCCDIKRQQCMYRECERCKGQPLHLLPGFNGLEPIKWNMWISKKEERVKVGREGDKQPITVQITVKDQQETSVSLLIEKFQTEMDKALRHFYNISHQYIKIRELKQLLSANEVVMHIDFSENYGCKYNREIQSAHFGASHSQVTLHTGVTYYNDGICRSFCTISESMRHDPSSIWAHLKPVLLDIRQTKPCVDTLHIVSDGPTTQYRCRVNFALFSTMLYTHGFNKGTWNFLEAGHGKGAADGVGGVVKRTADALVAQGKDISDAHQLYLALVETGTRVKLYEVCENEIADVDHQIPKQKIPAVQGTMRVHQILTNKHGEASFRILSCFCQKPRFCHCYNPKKYVLVTANNVPSDIEIEAGETSNVTIQANNATIDPDIECDKWVAAMYEGDWYIGIIKDIDESENECEISFLQNCTLKGRRIFKKPNNEDVLWVPFSNIVCIVYPPIPQEKSGRHYKLTNDDYTKIENNLELRTAL